ncbi:MAG: MFS transporter [Traorella sp.]
MTKNEKLIIAVAVLNTFASALSAVFMNVFLYTYTGSLSVMALYTCIRIAMFPICFTLAGKIARKINYGVTMSTGLFFLFLQCFFVLEFNEMIALNHNWVYFVALLYGIGEGFYWLSANTLYQLVTNPQTRNRFLGIREALSNIANVIAPLLATFIIDISKDDMSGYLNIFKLVLVVYLGISVLGLLIHEKGNPKPFSVLKSLTFQNDPQWKYVLVSYFIYGFRDSLILALAGLLVYNATGSGSLYGKLLAFFAVLTILSYMYVSKAMVRSNRMKFYTFGAILLASATIVLVLVPNIYGAIYYGVVNAIATAFYANPFNIITMNAINDYGKEENLAGRVIAKETYLSVSRCLGMLFIVLCHNLLGEGLYLYVSVILLSLSPIILVIYSNRYHKKRDQMKVM